ncbi:ABC transporter substrate-binding protein [Colwellia sp. 1_MG-2023]|uniref:ABC transporter substrate-binding protein n=1 Tax=Colwellia sp. 1_MG-2023 TaxID=3062649 RepID=UPI0026E18DBA|nr:ABC transporter substrate-binding protein [Colwellia sp. 1_MG-2023]MDO6446839.1 ABC transporter substrate-binding protein [Colwellia sp. 1_MG-2023]
MLSVNLNNFWQTEKYPVSIAVSKTPLSAPFYVAQSINAFDSSCVTVDFEHVIGGRAAFSKVLLGEVDFATSSDSVIAFQSLTQQTFVTHAMFVQSDNDVKLITRTEDNIKEVANLKGKNIGVTKQTSSEYFLRTLLAIDGLDIADVNLIDYEPEQLINGLMNKDVDAITPWEPFAFQSHQILDDKITIHDTKNLNTLSFNLISLTPDLASIEKAKCVIQGLNTAINYIASRPEDAKEIVIKELGVSAEFINWVWPDYIFKLELNQSLLLNLKSQTTWLTESHELSNITPPDVVQLVDSRAILQVNPSAVNINY